MKFNHKIILSFFLFCLITLPMAAQLTLPNGGETTVSDAPIDGLIAVGLIAGAAIGLKAKSKK